MAFIEEILSGLAGDERYHRGAILEVVTAPGVEPVTLAQVKEHLRISATSTVDDNDLSRFLTAARLRCEKETDLCFVQTVLRQTFDAVGRVELLFKRPVLSINSVKYIANFDADTQVTLASTNYTFTRDLIVARSSWPAHRGLQSLIVEFKSGFYALPASPTAGDYVSAQAAIPGHLKLAVLELAGHYFENREGQSPITTGSADSTKELLPRNVKDLLASEVRLSVI